MIIWTQTILVTDSVVLGGAFEPNNHQIKTGYVVTKRQHGDVMVVSS